MQIPGRSSGDHISAAQLAQAAQLAVVPRGGASRGGGRRPKAKFTADPSIEEVECEYDSQTNGILVQSMAAAQWAELYIYICMYVPSPGVSKGPGRRGIGCPETHGLAARFLLTDPGDGHRNRSLNRDRRRGGGTGIVSCRVRMWCVSTLGTKTGPGTRRRKNRSCVGVGTDWWTTQAKAVLLFLLSAASSRFE